MAKSTCFFLIVFFSLPIQAQVYHCEGPGGPVYSQMPCAEDAERLADYDPVVVASDGSGLDNGTENLEEAVQKPPNTMENFVLTLHKQREQQMGELDSNIAKLQNRLNSEENPDPEMDESERAALDAERADLAAQLAVLISERDSVSEQYTAMISEAERRADATDTTN